MAEVEENDEGRLEVAEEAVRIVRRFNMAKDKEERQKKIIELCTDIAGILDAKRRNRLEDLVEKQRTELEELRQQTGSANTSSSSGRGSLTPENACASTSTPQVSGTPSSGRGTAVCSRGTDPLYEWPERSSTSTCTRSTSPLLFPDLSDMTSPMESHENLTNQEGEKNNSDTVDEDKPAYEKEEKHSDEGNTDEEEHQPQMNKQNDEESEENEADQEQLAAKENDRKNKQRASQQKSTRSGKPEVASPKRQERKKIPATRDQSPRKSGREKQAREKTYKTLWKTNQMNLFDDSRSAKERKNNAKNRAKDKTSAGSKSKGAQLRGSNKNAADKYQSESSSSSCDSEEDEDLTRTVKPELTSEYWDIHKLIKFLKVGNPTATVIALCALRDVSLEQESSQLAILELGGINILLNILKTDHWPCVVGSLKILRVITNTKRINTEIYRLGGIQQLIDCLQHNMKEIQSLAAETLSHLVTFRLAYSAVRRGGGIKHLVSSDVILQSWFLVLQSRHYGRKDVGMKTRRMFSIW
ncbi:hypothetical protein ACROYT_G036080 [Oculina patagonica]